MDQRVSFKKHAIDTFLCAGIAFYLKGDWRGVFAKSTIPSYRRWKNREKADMEQALEIFHESNPYRDRDIEHP
jgi:hypothetical protein